MNYFKLIILTIFIISLGLGQYIPIEPDHSVNQFIRRMALMGHLPISKLNKQPYYIHDLQLIVENLDSKNNQVSKSDLHLLKQYLNEFNLEFKYGFDHAVHKESMQSHIQSLTSTYQPDKPKNYLFTYRDSSHIALGSFNQLTTIIKSQTPLHKEKVNLNLIINNQLSITSVFSMFHTSGTRTDNLDKEFYQNDWVLYEDHDYLFWYRSEASIYYTGSLFQIELSKLPLKWGYSNSNSPLFSGKALPFPYLGLSKSFGKIRLRSVHGSPAYKARNSRDNIPEKHVAAHRIDIDLTPNFIFSFNEFVVYGNRSLDLEYLLPPNFFWAAEHNLGDRDNILMAFDMIWRLKPGIAWYNTFLWDELDWLKMFKPWWGNKYVFQTGFILTSQSGNYPDVNIEYTRARPWVYTHKEPVNTFTSGEIGLGFPWGPNSRSLSVESNWWLTPRLYLQTGYTYVRKGSGPGSSPTDNYLDRDKLLDKNTPDLMGNITSQNLFSMSWEYLWKNSVTIKGNIKDNGTGDLNGQLGLLIQL